MLTVSLMIVLLYSSMYRINTRFCPVVSICNQNLTSWIWFTLLLRDCAEILTAYVIALILDKDLILCWNCKVDIFLFSVYPKTKELIISYRSILQLWHCLWVDDVRVYRPLWWAKLLVYFNLLILSYKFRCSRKQLTIITQVLMLKQDYICKC